MRLLLVSISILTLLSQNASAQNSSNLRSSLTFHASFDKHLDADFSKGETACFFRQGKETLPATLNDEIRIVPEVGRFDGALKFTKKGLSRPHFQGLNNVGYNDQQWNATVSIWLQLDPNRDLEPGYCDPVQIVGDDVKKGFIFLEWSKDESPRFFRFAIRPLIHIWNPDNVPWDTIPAAKRPMIQVSKAPFSRESWTHVVFSFEKLNDKNAKSIGRLHINGEQKGAIENWNLQFGWEPSQVMLVLGASYVGMMDELAVFDRALSNDEIKQLYGLENGVRDLYR